MKKIEGVVKCQGSVAQMKKMENFVFNKIFLRPILLKINAFVGAGFKPAPTIDQYYNLGNRPSSSDPK